MLVLNRKDGERLVVRHYPSGDEFEIVVANIRHNAVHIGIDGSEEMWVVHRKELLKPKAAPAPPQ